jgi:hypothetical protein
LIHCLQIRRIAGRAQPAAACSVASRNIPRSASRRSISFAYLTIPTQRRSFIS